MSRPALRTLAGPALLLAMWTLATLLSRPLLPIDETRYVSVAWEMWLHDEYLVLFKNGEPYSHKPPLLFWLYHLGWMVFGVNAWWPRLVSPLFSFGSLMLTLAIARRLWPAAPAAGHHALWILSTSLLWAVFSTAAMFDVMLTFFVLVGMRGLLIAAHESRRRGFAWLGLAIGMGVLAKGPVILLHLLPCAVLAPWWRPGGAGDFLPGQWKSWYTGLLVSVLTGAAIALAWAIPAALHGGEAYRNAIFWGQTANRMVNSFAHKRPFWWYVPLLPLLLFPWSFWPALWRSWVRAARTGLDAGGRFCLSWLAPVFLSLSFISGKQAHYLVPLLPAFALLSGRFLAAGDTGSLRLPVLITAAVATIMLLLATGLLPDGAGLPLPLPWQPALLLGVVILAAAWAGKTAARRLPALAFLATALYVLTQAYLSPLLWYFYDVRPLAEEIQKLQARGVPVAHVDQYHAQYHFAGRLQQPLVQTSYAELPGWLQRHPQGAVVAYVSRSCELPAVLFSQPYRGKTAVLLNAGQVRFLRQEGC